MGGEDGSSAGDGRESGLERGKRKGFNYVSCIRNLAFLVRFQAVGRLTFQ